MERNSVEAEEWKELHLAIEEGDTQSVRRIVDNHGQDLHFTYDDTSALYKAFECKKYEIISYLIHKGAKFIGSEDKYVYNHDIDLERVNHFLFDYNRRSERSCIHRLLSLSQSPQGLDEERLNALMSMYQSFFGSEIIKSLMKVVESVDFDIVFDFESDTVNRVHRFYIAESEIFGLTLSIVREIFVGGKDLLSGDPKKTAKVYGVVAEELCHLALTTVFQNDAKPYKEEDSKLIYKFNDIVRDVKSLVDRSSQIESVIRDVFEYYIGNSWECELIARVPHVIGIYGEESGKGIFKESSELSRLLDFYEQNVVPKCKEYTEPLLNTKSDRIMKQLIGKSETISFREKQIRPLKENFPFFSDYVVVEEGVSVLSTNCNKLSILHVYYELKTVYGDQLDRKCLFFGSECFEKKRDKILNALKCKICEYLVLVLEDKELHHRRLLCEYLDHFEGFEGMNIIVISNSQFLGPEFQKKAVEYKWDDLTDEYKDFRTQPLEYIFKGERKDIFIKKENVPKLFCGEDIISIISGDLIEVKDGSDLYSHGFNSETYIEREFKATIVDRKLFENVPSDTYIFVNGLSCWDIEELTISKSVVQWLKGSEDEIQKGKAIFINNKERPINFNDFVEKTAVENSICLQYDRKVFYLMNRKGDACKQHEKEIRQTEEEMIALLKSNKSLIISDNSGCGKSTAMSHLIWLVKKNIYNSWVLRVDLNKFSIEDDGPDCEENDEGEVFEDIFDMLGIENGFEKCLFRDNYNQENYFIFLDAFDEIQSKYKTKALKLISFLRENTDARIMITTRLHHQQELEEILNAFSHKLIPFDNLSQVDCLGRLWKWKLKFPSGEGSIHTQKDKKSISRKIKNIMGELENERTNSESMIIALKELNLDDSLDSIRKKIDGLELSRLAYYILKKTCLDKETLQFMGIPLHLFMVGSIYYESNFNLAIDTDIYGIYVKFIEQKIRIYVEEKLGIMHGGRTKENVMKKEKEDAYRIHMELANQLMEMGKIDCDMSEEDLELCSSLGIVFVNGGEINFLHRTFAEFFKAEFIRQYLNKSEFLLMLFQGRYKIVTRFLSSSLERNDFENLERVLLEDVDFLMYVLYHLGERFYFPSDPSTSHESCVAKIVRKLLEEFEKTVDAGLLNALFVELERELSRSPTSRIHLSGGCLPVKMLKAFLNRNVDSRMILGMVRYYSNPEEVLDVLTDCVSSETAVERGSKVLKLFKFEGTRGCLLQHALLNAKAEIFAVILKFFMDDLGEEQFVEGIVQSDEYRKTMERFVSVRFFNRTCSLLRDLYSVFGNQIEILFDVDLKLSMFKKGLTSYQWMAFSEEFEVGVEFQEFIGLFARYFGTENLKRVLSSSDSEGNYLIHTLAQGFNKKRAENLNVLINVFDDKDELKQFIKRLNGNSRNLLHCVSSDSVWFFGDLFRFCGDHLEKEEIKSMLVNTDKDGESVLQLLVKKDPYETLIENLKLINETLDDIDWFKTFLKGKDENLRGVFHFAASNSNFGDLLKFCEAYLEKDEVKLMLVSVDKNGEDAWRALPTLIFDQNSIANLSLLKDYIRDKEIFKQFLKRRDKRYGNLLHCAVFRKNLCDVLRFCEGNLEKDEIKEILVSQDVEGRTVLSSLLERYPFENLIDILNGVKHALADDAWFKEFLRNGDVYSKLVSKMFLSSNSIVDFLQLCDVNLEKDEMREMFLRYEENGKTLLHLLLENNSFGTLIQNLDAIKDSLSGGGWFRQFLMSKDHLSRNVFHFAVLQSDFADYLRYFGAGLQKGDVKKMMVSADKNGDDPVHLLFAFSSTESLIRNLNALKDTVADEEFFKQLLKSRDGFGRNVFHSAAENRNRINLHFISSHLGKFERRQLLIEKDVFGKSFLHFAAESQPRNLPFWLDYAHGMLISEECSFEEIILPDEDGGTFLHSLHKSRLCSLFRITKFDFKDSAEAILKSLREKLTGERYEKLLRIRNHKGQTFLQIESNYGKEMVKSFEGFIEKNLLEELLGSDENYPFPFWWESFKDI